MNNEFLTVKEFASKANVSTQYIYKLIKTSLQPYLQLDATKTLISVDGLQLFATDTKPDIPEVYTDSDENAVATQLPTNCNQFTTKLEELQTKCNQLQTENSALTERLQALQDELEDLRRDRNSWQAMAVQLTAQNNLLTARIPALEAGNEQKKSSFWARIFKR